MRQGELIQVQSNCGCVNIKTTQNISKHPFKTSFWPIVKEGKTLSTSFSRSWPFAISCLTNNICQSLPRTPNRYICPIYFLPFQRWVKFKMNKFRMNLWGHRFSKNANLKLQGFLPDQTNKDRSTFFGDFLVSIGSFFGYNLCLLGRAEILVIFSSHFGFHSEFNNSFWI